MDIDGFEIGVLISLHDGGLAWWTEDQVLQERTASSLQPYCVILLCIVFLVNSVNFTKI